MAIRLRVLVIEDSEDDTALVVRELRRADYDVDFKRVDSRHTLKTALAAEDWDIVISDFSMPGFSGTEALQLVRALRLDIPFFFVSGTMDEDVAVSALKEGAQDYLIKANLKRLAPAVQRELLESEARREHRRLEQHVQQLQKFEAIGRLAGGIAHDFNNAIGAILGWAEMGCEEAPGGTRSHDRFNRIREQALWAGRLTSQLLAFARRQILQPRNINLNTMVEESMNLLRRIIGEQIEVSLLLAHDLRITRADPTQVEQVFVNLCLNARDAMLEGGRLTIETRNVEVGEEFHRHHPYAKIGCYVLLSVSDTGVGMDAATLERVFEPFFTTKHRGRGTGLGLSTVYGVVKQHGGFINADSTPGKGTQFRVHFPAAEGTGTHEQREIRHDERPRKGTETILLADDNDALRQSAREMLETLGYSVLAAPDGAEAVQLFRNNAERIDLVVLDVVMPRLGGLEAHAQMAAIRPDVAVVFTSGYTAEMTALRTALENGTPILQKPYGMKSISQAIGTALDTRHRR